MAKFLKSLFHPNETKRENTEEDRSDLPPLDGRRKLSISRSGRLKANKKRHSLSLDLYGENLHRSEKPSVKEYHVHGRGTFNKSVSNIETSHSQHSVNHSQQSIQSNNSADSASIKTEFVRRKSTDLNSPEEEIDKAFEVIDKS